MRKYALIIGAMVTAAAAWAVDATDHIFLSEILYKPAATSPPVFVELYNSSNANVPLKDWYFKIYGVGGPETATFPDDAVVPAHGFYLVGLIGDRIEWGHYSYQPDFYAAVEGPFSHERGGVALYKANNQLRDAAGWGAAPWPFYEGASHLAVAAGHSLERKSGPIHNEIRGNAYDTNNNANDFRDRNNPEPQNINSPREYPSANTEYDAWGRIKAMYYGQK